MSASVMAEPGLGNEPELQEGPCFAGRCLEPSLGAYFKKDLPAGPDFDFTLALLKLHPKASDKIGTGIKRFWVDTNEGPSTSFYFERADGGRDDFSTAKCIRDMKRMPHQ